MTLMTGVVLMIGIGALVQGNSSGSSLLSGSGAFEARPDTFTIIAGREQDLDVFLNDANPTRIDPSELSVMRQPRCGAAEAVAGKVRVTDTGGCEGEIELSYCVPYEGGCDLTDVTIEILPGTPVAAPEERPLTADAVDTGTDAAADRDAATPAPAGATGEAADRVAAADVAGADVPAGRVAEEQVPADPAGEAAAGGARRIAEAGAAADDSRSAPVDAEVVSALRQDEPARLPDPAGADALHPSDAARALQSLPEAGPAGTVPRGIAEAAIQPGMPGAPAGALPDPVPDENLADLAVPPAGDVPLPETGASPALAAAGQPDAAPDLPAPAGPEALTQVPQGHAPDDGAEIAEGGVLAHLTDGTIIDATVALSDLPVADGPGTTIRPGLSVDAPVVPLEIGAGLDPDSVTLAAEVSAAGRVASPASDLAIVRAAPVELAALEGPAMLTDAFRPGPEVTAPPLPSVRPAAATADTDAPVEPAEPPVSEPAVSEGLAPAAEAGADSPEAEVAALDTANVPAATDGTGAAPALAGSDCETAITLEDRPGAEIGLSVESACRPGARFDVEHGGLAFSATLDSTGRAVAAFPAMDSRGEVRVRFVDGAEAAATVAVNGLEDVTRVAVISGSAIALELNAYEFGARPGSRGHVWRDNPRDLRSARRDGGGYLTVLGPEGDAEGRRALVYTLPMTSRTREGLVDLELVAVGSAESCAAPVDLRTIRVDAARQSLNRNQQVRLSTCDGAVPLRDTVRDIQVVRE
jgi:hypothetical protein